MMNKKTRGGKREGAGRPRSNNPRTQRPLKASDIEWGKIKEYAKEKQISTNEYIVRRALRLDE